MSCWVLKSSGKLRAIWAHNLGEKPLLSKCFTISVTWELSCWMLPHKLPATCDCNKYFTSLISASSCSTFGEFAAAAIDRVLTADGESVPILAKLESAELVAVAVLAALAVGITLTIGAGLSAALASAFASAKATASCFFFALTAALTLALKKASLSDGLITLASPRRIRSAPLKEAGVKVSEPGALTDRSERSERSTLAGLRRKEPKGKSALKGLRALGGAMARSKLEPNLLPKLLLKLLPKLLRPIGLSEE